MLTIEPSIIFSLPRCRCAKPVQVEHGSGSTRCFAAGSATHNRFRAPGGISWPSLNGLCVGVCTSTVQKSAPEHSPGRVSERVDSGPLQLESASVRTDMWVTHVADSGLRGGRTAWLTARCFQRPAEGRMTEDASTKALDGSNTKATARGSTSGRRPGRFKLAFQRFPILFYRLGLGRLMGKHHLLLVHRGRKSGRLYRTVLEVIAHDEGGKEWIVATMWGVESDWYRNIRAGGAVAVQTSRHSFSPEVRILAADEASRVLAVYVAAHPRWSRVGSRYTGRQFSTDAMSLVGLTEP